MSLTVACALVGTKWPDVWVHRLHRMVQEHCSVDFDFKVITDRPEAFPEWGVPLEREIVWTDEHHSRLRDDPKLILQKDKPQGCWAKMEAFRPGFASGHVIVLDLDICILDDVADLRSYWPQMPEDKPGHLNGSVYSFHTDGIPNEVYPRFIPYTTHPRGEQEYAAKALDADVLPNCYSFKNCVASRPGKAPPPGTRIVFFHGRPTPADPSLQQFGWISRTWRGLDRRERI